MFVICTGKGGRMVGNTKVAAALLAILVGLSQADTITVGPGLIYDFTSIQAAINVAKEGDTVLVAKGWYREKIVFPGENILVTSTDPNDPGMVQQTVIDCPSFRQTPVVTFSGTENESCELTGFTIRDGSRGIQGNGTKATISNCAIGNNFPTGSGGGLYDCDGPIRSCKIINNEADSKGGGLYDCDGPISNCTVSENLVRGNSTTDGGGGLYGCDGPITNCTISENWAWFDAGSGGGLHSCHGAITSCTIRDNGARGHGGGLSNCNGSISECTITGNRAKDPAFQSRGGGLYDCDGTISGCTITGNEADEAGGGLYGCDGLVTQCKILNNASTGWNGGGLAECDTTLNCVISDNSAAGSGGGLERCHSITSCLVSANVAGRDGGALHECAEVFNCTMTGNKAGGNGAAIYYSGTESIVGNSILWDNKAAEGAQIYLDAPLNAGTGEGSGWMSVAYSDVQGGTAEVYVAASSTLDWDASNIEVDPGFVQPGHWTADGAWVDGDYHLVEGSPCIDAGYQDFLPELAEADLDGNPRVINGIVDMGAHESRYAVNWHVDAVSGNDSYDGLTPETAFATIQKGIAAAEDGDTVIVYPGTYFENIRFKGNNITVRSTDPNDPNAVAATIIDGGQNGSVVTFNSGEDATCVLTGFTITNGRSDRGGGIMVSGASPTISHCTLTGNSAAQFGGGVYSVSGTPTLTYCTFSENSAGMGGGMHNHFDSHPTLTHCNFNSNSAEYGAGMSNYGGSKLILRQCTLTANSAQYGGGLFLEPSRMTLTNCKLSHNSAIQGGAIHADVSIVEIANSCLTKNSAAVGAGIYSLDGHVTITNSLLSENAASEQGGAIFLYGGPNAGIVANNCTFVRNTAAEGRAIACHGELGDKLVTITVTNSILWNGGDEIWYDGNFTIIVTYSDVQDGWPGEGNLDADPRLAPDGYHLEPNSPCINVGDPMGDYTGQTDIDGEPRVLSGRIDIGADEYSGALAGIYYVDAFRGNDLNDGRSPGTAFATIQKGIDAAEDGDTVIVADGIYVGEGNRDITFGGKPLILRSENGPLRCVIDCQKMGRGFFFHDDEGTNSVVEGFAIVNGLAYEGGGIYCGSSPTIRNCIIRLNRAQNGGGLAIQNFAEPTIMNCVIAENVCGGLGGGGIDCHNASPKIANCTIVGNSTNNEGGAILCKGYSYPQITNCIFWANSPSGMSLAGGAWADVTYCDVQGGWPGQGNINANPRFAARCYPAEIAGMVSRWRFDEGSGDIAYDSVGDNHGTIYGTQWTAGKLGGALSFNGRDDYVSLSSNGVITTEFTISAWANQQGLAGGSLNTNIIFSQRDDITGNNRCAIALLTERSYYSPCAAAGIRSSSGSVEALDHPTQDYNQWHHYAMTVGPHDFAFYIDATEVGRTPNQQAGDYVTSIDYVTIARARYEQDNVGFFNGLIDEVLIFDRALSADEIQQLYDGQPSYELLPDSPCIDAGDPTYVPQPDETDLYRNPRVRGEAVDIGAVELQPLGLIELSVDKFEFEATVGFPGPADQILLVRNAGAGILNWQISCDCDWLRVEPNFGRSKGEGNTAWLRVNTAGLSSGQYDCTLAVSSPFAMNTPQMVQVRLLVHNNCFPDTPQYARQYADFLEYAGLGADPSCWCASPSDGNHYQCDGDASGRTQAFTNYRVFTDDLALIIKNWKKKIDTADPCADIDHQAQLFLNYRVFTNDLAILVTNWKKRDDQLPNDCPRPDGQ